MPSAAVGAPGGGGCPRQRVAAVYCRAHCCKMHPAGLVAGGAELRWALLGFSGHCWTRGSHPRAQKCRFCVKTTQNLGKIAHFDTKNPILCSKGGKTGEKSPFLTQKPRFCARKGRKWGFRRAKAHKNLDFVLEKTGIGIGKRLQAGEKQRCLWVVGNGQVRGS